MLAFIALLTLQFHKVDALPTVESPEKDLTVVSDRTFTVEWTNSGNNTQFEIDLFHNATSESECGTFVTMLCKLQLSLVTVHQ